MLSLSELKIRVKSTVPASILEELDVVYDSRRTFTSLKSDAEMVEQRDIQFIFANEDEADAFHYMYGPLLADALTYPVRREVAATGKYLVRFSSAKVPVVRT